MPSSATRRIEALADHLSATAPTPATQPSNMSTDKKPPITCHVLDTTIGKPAANIPVLLTLLNPTSEIMTKHNIKAAKFKGTTNSDGRITSWGNILIEHVEGSLVDYETLQSLDEVWAEESKGDKAYSLTFDTEKYFSDRGIKTFFPEVTVQFVIREEQRKGRNHEAGKELDIRNHRTMRLMHRAYDGTLDLTGDLPNDGEIPPYAILSHRWAPEEVTYRDFVNRDGMHNDGYNDILFLKGVYLGNNESLDQIIHDVTGKMNGTSTGERH
ncbi:hypothetical protein E8E11_006633 [Didymella keratinophila]|nr:hypothetical protein E8E11_006633 [Didymella keratinophila]